MKGLHFGGHVLLKQWWDDTTLICKLGLWLLACRGQQRQTAACFGTGHRAVECNMLRQSQLYKCWQVYSLRTILRNIHEVTKVKSKVGLQAFIADYKMPENATLWKTFESNKNSCIPLFFFFFNSMPNNEKDKLSFQRFLLLGGGKKKEWLTKTDLVRWRPLFKVGNGRKDNFAFNLTTSHNGQCTTQPRFQSHDLPWPISLRMVHLYVYTLSYIYTYIQIYSCSNKNNTQDDQPFVFKCISSPFSLWTQVFQLKKNFF